MKEIIEKYLDKKYKYHRARKRGCDCWSPKNVDVFSLRSRWRRKEGGNLFITWLGRPNNKNQRSWRTKLCHVEGGVVGTPRLESNQATRLD